MQTSNIPLHTGLAAEHVLQALDYRQSGDGSPEAKRYEAESFYAARKEAYLAETAEAETLPPIATAALSVTAWVLIGMLAYAVAVILRSL